MVDEPESQTPGPGPPREEPLPGGESPPRHPPGWTQADAALAARIELEEQRLAAEEKRVRATRTLVVVVLVLVALVVAALITSLVALNRDIEAVAKASPKDDSVSTAAIQDGAVTPPKLADRAVGGAKLADGAVGQGKLAEGAVARVNLVDGAVDGVKLADGAVVAGKLAEGSVGSVALASQSVINAKLGPQSVGTKKLIDGAVTAAKVAKDSLTGAQIKESTLGEVPDAASLGGVEAEEYLSGVRVVQATSADDLKPIKGPVTATCPSGTRAIAGGAAVDGAVRGVAITTSAPTGNAAWVASAEAFKAPGGSWRLVVTVVCAA